MRKLLALSLLLLALAVIATPIVLAVMAFVRGDIDEARAVVGLVLLIPLAFIVVGVWFSLKRDGSSRHRGSGR